VLLVSIFLGSCHRHAYLQTAMSARLPTRQSVTHSRRDPCRFGLNNRSVPGRKDVAMIPSNIVHRKESARVVSVASLPEDNHNAGPHEEAWLLVKEPTGSGVGLSGKSRSKLRVMGMDVTPELVAISMGEANCNSFRLTSCI
jgi:hypothetical protein